MINVNTIEGKTEEEVLSQINTNEIHYSVEEQPAKLFKGKKYTLKYVNKSDVKAFIKDFISKFSTSVNKKINVEIRENEDSYSVMLLADDNAVIIGKDGKTLNSLQLLLHQSLNNITGFNIRISVDAGNYKSNKEKRLERQIKNICKDVLSSKVEVKLDPMNSYERRIVHNVVSNFEGLDSKSYDEEPNRYVVISIKED